MLKTGGFYLLEASQVGRLWEMGKLLLVLHAWALIALPSGVPTGQIRCGHYVPQDAEQQGAQLG